MALRDYGSGVSTVIVSGIGTGDASCVIGDATGWPTGAGGNFFVTCDGGAVGEERILCSTRSGTTLNFATRGADGTSASTHNANASIWPSSSKTDLQEANTHVNSSAGVHGLAGTVVGTSDAQNLTNKTITNATVTGATITGGTINVPSIQQAGVTLVDLSSTQTLSNKTLTSPTINSATLSGTLTGATVNATTLQQGGVQAVTTTGTQTLTNKTLTTPIISSISNTGTLTLPTSTDTLVGKATTDTLTNKTLTSPTLSGTMAGGTVNPTTLQQGGVAATIYRIPSQTTTLTSGAVTTSGASTLTLLTLGAITGDAATRVRIDFCGWTVTGSAGNIDDVFDFRIVDSVAGTLATARYRTSNNTARNDPCPSFFYVDTPSAASHTYTVTVTRISGGGTLTVSNAAGFPLSAALAQFGN